MLYFDKESNIFYVTLSHKIHVYYLDMFSCKKLLHSRSVSRCS